LLRIVFYNAALIELRIDMEKKVEFDEIFSKDVLTEIFPIDKADQFFELLYGDADEGAYDIDLSYNGFHSGQLEFMFNLRRRPGKCLACNLTYGLPKVFSRHPTVDIEGLVQKFKQSMKETIEITHWQLGETREISRDLHIIPLKVFIQEKRQ
jgi:hypothetical protein